MEILFSSKHQKCLHITSEQENEVVVSTTLHPFIPFVREEEEMAEIMKLNLVKEAENDAQTNDKDGDYITQTSANPDDDDATRKSVRHQSLEKLQKASTELSQLIALTENVNTQEHFVLLTRIMRERKTIKVIILLHFKGCV